MAAITPFFANLGATTGKTVIVPSSASNTSVASTLDSTNKYAPSLTVVSVGPNLAWVRLSSEATPTATSADIPILGNSVRLFANPVPNGVLGIAVIVSVTTSANTLYFTPGQGGQ